VLERINLQEASSWALLAEPETWILVLDGHAAIGLAMVSIGQAMFVGGGPQQHRGWHQRIDRSDRVSGGPPHRFAFAAALRAFDPTHSISRAR
jgi:hypothetical protein